MEPNERTRDVYEQIPAYPKPPLVPLPTLEELDTLLTDLGQPRGSLARAVTDFTLGLTRFRPFLRALPDRIEELLRGSNLRLPGLFAPVIAATLALEDDPRGLEPLTRAATLICAARSFHADLMSGRLPPDTYRGETLEMGQYPNFFSTHQIIEGKSTRLFKSSQHSQVNVMVNGQMYLLPIGEPGAELSVGQIAAGLAQIVERAGQETDQPGRRSPALLTAALHRTQYRGFAALQQRPCNLEALAALRHTFLTVCLDLDDRPESHAAAARQAHSQHLDNRWFHASLQFVVFGNARACAVCNFTAYLDGNTMMRGGAEFQRRAASCMVDDASRPAANLLPAAPLKLNWETPEPLLAQARRDLKPVLDDQPATFEIADFGRNWLTSHSAEAVPTFILALQLTAMRLTGQPARITQFVTMSRYRCTDLTTAVVSTPEVLRFAAAAAQETTQPGAVAALFQPAINSQRQAVRAAREHLGLPIIFNLLVQARRGAAQLLTAAAFMLRALLLQRMGLSKDWERQILVSHPEIYPEVPVIGRPGIRIPYVKYFGLHYQIWADKTVITLMPGLRWQIPNTRLIADLTDSLRYIQRVLEEGTSTETTH